MRIWIPCNECMKPGGNPQHAFSSVELRDDGLYETICPSGHAGVVALQHQKFEILFHQAILALLDGYPREAISGVASALERFNEFYVRVICAKHGIEAKLVDEIWGRIENQSERQFGAYLFVALLDRREAVPASVDEERPEFEGVARGKTLSWRGFRNAVIHKGHIPSSGEAMAYCSLVFDHIGQLMQHLKRNEAAHVNFVTVQQLKASIDHQANKQLRTATMSIATVLSLTRNSHPESLAEAMKHLAVYRHLIHPKEGPRT